MFLILHLYVSLCVPHTLDGNSLPAKLQNCKFPGTSCNFRKSVQPGFPFISPADLFPPTAVAYIYIYRERERHRHMYIYTNRIHTAFLHCNVYPSLFLYCTNSSLYISSPRLLFGTITFSYRCVLYFYRFS